MYIFFKMKKYLNDILIISFKMKIKDNEKFILQYMIENPNITNNELASKLDITTQAVGKIKKQLYSKGIISGTEIQLDYEKIGIGLFAIALIKIMPRAFKKFKTKDLNNILQPENVIHSFILPQSDVTHIIIYAFRNVEEYDNYFKTLQTELGEYVEIKQNYVLSPKSMIKSSSKEIYLKILKEYGKNKELPEPHLSKDVLSEY